LLLALTEKDFLTSKSTTTEFSSAVKLRKQLPAAVDVVAAEWNWITQKSSQIF